MQDKAIQSDTKQYNARQCNTHAIQSNTAQHKAIKIRKNAADKADQAVNSGTKI